MQLAGAGGIEPPYDGIKIRCLTAWRRPIACRVIGRAEPRVKREPQRRQQLRKCRSEHTHVGDRPAPHPPARTRQRSGRRPGRRGDSYSPKQVAPDPLMRASRQFGSAEKACSTSLMAGASRRAGGSRSLRVSRRVAASDAASRHASGKAAREENPPARARNTAGVETSTPGLISTIPRCGSPGAGSNRSPIPDIRAGRPNRHTGTSAPSAGGDEIQSGPARDRTRHSRQTQTQRRRGVGRPSANAGSDRQILFQNEAAGRYHAGFRRQGTGRAQHQIVGLAVKAGGKRASHRK